MKPHYKPIPLLYVTLFGLCITGCVNLRQVQDFAVGAGKGLAIYNELPCTYTGFCYDKCRLEQLKAVELGPIACNCDNERAADSITYILYNALGRYFEGLARLSGAALTDYKYDGLVNALKEADMPGLQVNSSNVQAYGTLAGIISKVVADGYRRKKLAGYITVANDPVHNIIKALALNTVVNLRGKLELKMLRMEHYYADLLQQKGLSAYEKKQVIDAYIALQQQFNAEGRQLAAYGVALQKIANGHQTLYDNRNRLNKKDMQAIAADAAGQVGSAIAAFKKIKN